MPCSAVQGAKSQQELAKLVAENLLAFDSKFWLRMATRADAAESREDKERLTALANVRPLALPEQCHCRIHHLHAYLPCMCCNMMICGVQLLLCAQPALCRFHMPPKASGVTVSGIVTYEGLILFIAACRQ